MVRNAGRIVAILVLVTCFIWLTAESRRASFSSDESHRVLADSTKIVKCRAVDTVPRFQVIPYPEMPAVVFHEAPPQLEIFPPPICFISPVYLFRPPPVL